MYNKNYSINGFTQNEIDAEFSRLADLEIKAMTYVRTPIFITIDLSGSMRNYLSMIKEIIKTMDTELRVVPKRDFTLFIIGIYNGIPRILYFGDLKQFNYENFISAFPKSCYGSTPLAQSFSKADELLNRFNEICKRNRHWFTIPVFFSITDSQATDSADDCSSITSKYKKDIADNNKLLVEFVTGTNPNGLNLGGYKVPIDEAKSKSKVTSFMNALRVATSTEAELEEARISKMPSKRNIEEYNRYMSDIMLANFKFCYDRNC